MGSKTITMLGKAWFGDEKVIVDFPDTWDVVLKAMPGHDRPALTDQQIGEALQKPIGTPTITELAKGKKQVVILFDDLTRPTPASRIVPHVIQALREGGIEDNNIRFMCAQANHRAMTREDFAKKLGHDIPTRFRVYNHNPFQNFVDLGRSSRGTPVKINREVMNCDLKIGIGSLIPHPTAGVGGGAKMILPGVASLETVQYNHLTICRPGGKKNPTTGQGKIDGNEVRLDMEEVARMAGLDFKIDVTINGQRDISALFCGDFVKEHRAGCELAKQLYITQPEKECDIVVSNCYPDDGQVNKGVWPAAASLKAEGGSAVVYANAVEGECIHYHGGRWGADYGGPAWTADRMRSLPHAKRIIYWSEVPTCTLQEALGTREQVIVRETWAQVLLELMAAHGNTAKVAVYPNVSLQCAPL